MFTTTKTVDLTMLYVREGKNPDSDTSRGTGGKGEGRGGGIAQMTLFISSSGQEKSPYTVSRSTSLGQAPSMCTIASVFSSLAMHARTSPSYLTISLFLRLSPPPSSLYAPIVRSLVRTQTNREGRTRIGIRIRVHGMASRSASPRYWRATAVSPRIRAGRGRP